MFLREIRVISLSLQINFTRSLRILSMLDSPFFFLRVFLDCGVILVLALRSSCVGTYQPRVFIYVHEQLQPDPAIHGLGGFQLMLLIITRNRGRRELFTWRSLDCGCGTCVSESESDSGPSAALLLMSGISSTHNLAFDSREQQVLYHSLTCGRNVLGDDR